MINKHHHEITKHIHNNRLAVIIKPNAHETKIIGWDEQESALRIAIQSPAIDNKANLELLSFLKKQTKRACRILSGATSRKKVILFSEAPVKISLTLGRAALGDRPFFH